MKEHFFKIGWSFECWKHFRPGDFVRVEILPSLHVSVMWCDEDALIQRSFLWINIEAAWLVFRAALKRESEWA
jgi:hypothetical protein